MNFPKGLQKKLNERKETNGFRTLQVWKEGIDFYSNDYLGIARIKGETHLLEGATGSRLISGDSAIAHEVEEKAAHFFQQPAGLLYNSGYTANLGLLSAVPQRGDTILYDERCHASIRDGIQLSKAIAYKFRHNDLDHLRSHLKKASGDVFVIVESIYSMNGDKALLHDLSKTCLDFGAYLMVDEAHACGVYGDQGGGLCTAKHWPEKIKVFAKIITFGKAFGSHGAMILGSQELKDYLINFSRPLIYTTALPPNAIERILFALQTVQTADQQRNHLADNIQYFRQKSAELSLNILESHSPIQGLIIPGNTAAKKKAKTLTDNGFLVKAILSPTVPKGQERIRICLHSFNTKKEIDQLLNQLL